MPAVAHADILIHRPDGQFIAAVQVKNRQELSPEIAATLRAKMIANDILPEVPYFILASQDHGYLWFNGSQADSSAQPDISFDTREVVKRYIANPEANRRLSPSELEFIFQSWIWQLTVAPDFTLDPERTLAPSGFLTAIANANVAWGQG